MSCFDAFVWSHFEVSSLRIMKSNVIEALFVWQTKYLHTDTMESVVREHFHFHFPFTLSLFLFLLHTINKGSHGPLFSLAHTRCARKKIIIRESYLISIIKSEYYDGENGSLDARAWHDLTWLNLTWLDLAWLQPYIFIELIVHKLDVYWTCKHEWFVTANAKIAEKKDKRIETIPFICLPTSWASNEKYNKINRQISNRMPNWQVVTFSTSENGHFWRFCFCCSLHFFSLFLSLCLSFDKIIARDKKKNWKQINTENWV